MFDLQPGVHFHKEEASGSAADVMNSTVPAPTYSTALAAATAASPSRSRSSASTIEKALFHHLLVAPLQAAFALAEVDHMAVRVGEDLHLDMAWLGDESFEEKRVVAEGSPGLSARLDECRPEFGGRIDGVHTFAAAAGGGLTSNGKPISAPASCRSAFGHTRLSAARNDRNPRRRHRLLGTDFVAHSPNGGYGRPE